MIDLSQLQSSQNISDLQNNYDLLLGKSGQITTEFKQMWALDPEARKSKWAELSTLKSQAENIYQDFLGKFKTQEINAKLANDIVDISLDVDADYGHQNLLDSTRREVEDIFASMWFQIFYGQEVLDKKRNFETLNIPLTHPATEIHDTFYIDDVDDRWENLVLRTHTTANYNDIISKIGPVCRFASLGQVYRNEKLDATHDIMFINVDGAVIDKWISISNAKAFLVDLVSKILHRDVKIRLRPAYFPFVEPGFEIDVDCHDDPELLKLSKWSGRLEVLGAGMLHPDVLRQAGVDPDIYSWFAFGMGLSRLVAIRYGIKDIRLFTNGDIRFLKSF